MKYMCLTTFRNKENEEMMYLALKNTIELLPDLLQIYKVFISKPQFDYKFYCFVMFRSNYQ